MIDIFWRAGGSRGWVLMARLREVQPVGVETRVILLSTFVRGDGILFLIVTSLFQGSGRAFLLRRFSRDDFLC